MEKDFRCGKEKGSWQSLKTAFRSDHAVSDLFGVTGPIIKALPEVKGRPAHPRSARNRLKQQVNDADQ